MIALLLAAALQGPDLDRLPVSVDDVRAFRVDAGTAYSMWTIASWHPQRMDLAVRWNNDAGTVARWEAECRWRTRVWDLVDNVLRCHADNERMQVQDLRELLRLLGPEDYYGGRLPAPIPSYKD